MFQTLALALFGLANIAAAADDPKANMQSIELKTHTLQSPFLDGEMSSRWWDFGGDAYIRTDSYVRLTPDKPSRKGWLFSRVPLTATNWEIEVEFAITGQGNMYGDGLAIWLTRDRADPGDVFGHADQFQGLGIFFDTYKNNRPGTSFPYVMAMLGDGEKKYDKNNDGKENELAGCSARGIRNAAVPTKARITYFKDANLVLSLQYREEDEWILCFDQEKVEIPSVAYLGFSAETGELHSNHDIISVTTKNLYDAEARQKQRKKHQEEQRRANLTRGRKGWGWTFLKFLVFLAFCGAGYLGFTAYRARQRSRF